MKLSGGRLDKQAPVAQLDRVFGYEPKGRGFESLLAHQQRDAAPNFGTQSDVSLFCSRENNFVQRLTE